MTTAAGPPAQQCPLQSFPHFCGEVSAKNSFADLCSLADTYLAYSYLCRSGLWRQVTLAADPAQGYVLCCDPLVQASEDADIDVIRDGGDDAADGSDSDSGFVKDDGEPEQAAAAGGAAATVAADTAEAKALQRHRTVTVPVSLARGALTFARLNRLFALCGAYGAKRVDMATVDNDGTVIVSHIYDYPLAPEPLVLDSEDVNKDDDLVD